jgi:serine/threonine protein kinase
MKAPPDAGSFPGDESGSGGALPLTLSADCAVRPIQQPQLELSRYELDDDDSQFLDVTLHQEDPGMRGAGSIDDTPTAQLSPDQQQLVTKDQIRGELLPGCVLRSRYVLEDIIGSGGSSTIFRAKDRHRASSHDMAASFVAIKLLRTELRTDPLAIKRLKREFQQMQFLSHPGIVRVFDLDCDGDVWFICMELVAGLTAKTWIETPGNHSNALDIIGGCCEAIEHAHSLGIVHGDVNATNVLVTADGRAKLIDFGSVPSYGSPASAESNPALAVTPLYASPQILAGKSAELRDDVYSLACLSYNILSGGRHPFGGRPSLEDGRAKSAPTYAREIPAELFAIIERGLSSERERRPASVSQFLRDLTEADRRRRADATSPATPARGNVRAVRDPGSVTHTAHSASQSAVPTTVADIFGGGRGSYRRAQPLAMLITLVVAIVGIAALFRLGTHRDVILTPKLRPEASATSPELAVTARTQSELVRKSRSSLHDSGIISFEASTVHASAGQSLVAISVKRLQGTRSRGAFVWRLEQGTAHPGVDYERIKPHIVHFNEGQTTRTLFIPLINTPATLDPRGPRTFNVALEQVAGGPALGRIARITVAIDQRSTSSPLELYQARAKE